MNKYLIKCINDCSISYAVAYASSLEDDMMDIAADNHAFDVAVSIVPDSLIVQLEGYDYDDLKPRGEFRILRDDADARGTEMIGIQECA